MKPPPRKRTKPDRNFKLYSSPQGSGNQVPKKWRRAEQNKLLNGLRRLSKTGGNREIDYAFLTKYVPNRSVSEVRSMVELLKHKVLSGVSHKLKRKRWEEESSRKPIEVWTDMASAVAGTLEEPISTAFSQMLIVSSAEPRTLRNGDPPQFHSLPTDKDSRTVPWRPMPCLAVKGERPSTNAAQPLQGFKSPAPVVRVPIIKIRPAQQQLSNTVRTSLSSVTVTPRTRQARTSSSSAAVAKTQIFTSTKSTLSRPHPAPSSSATSPTTVPSATPSSVASSGSAASHSSSSQSTPSLSTPAAAIRASSGHTGKFATKDSPRMLGVKHVVDFEKIYRYLSCIHKPNEGCCLTPMESAIVLDLLMSLPEELPLLDCNRLQQHLIQVYHSFSSPANSKVAREMFKEMQAELGARTETTSDPASNGTSGRQDTAGTADNSDVAHSGGEKIKPDEAESQSPGNTDASSQANGAGVMPPPLNPFMIPLKLLRRK
ncbi:snRNA-activating protein complex subunit 2 [Acanthopagrus latus]|uniref:snRNA-activating protein complex subunit 2 n=1 Tax=Acanthopagrus latus TaxID=8177 RepID=UPI00187C3D6F|nr:snRNA-activating protein complex subunit 2 [Acanthopagrus latus]